MSTLEAKSLTPMIFVVVCSSVGLGISTGTTIYGERGSAVSAFFDSPVSAVL
jgi:hypothetical protein